MSDWAASFPPNPYLGLAEQARATLRDLLVEAGLGAEATTVLPPFERAVRAAVAAVETGLPGDLSLEFALAYLTGRIAREQALALQRARRLAATARARAERRWQGAIEAERGRIARAAAAEAAETPRRARALMEEAHEAAQAEQNTGEPRRATGG